MYFRQLGTHAYVYILHRDFLLIQYTFLTVCSNFVSAKMYNVYIIITCDFMLQQEKTFLDTCSRVNQVPSCNLPKYVLYFT